MSDQNLHFVAGDRASRPKMRQSVDAGMRLGQMCLDISVD